MKFIFTAIIAFLASSITSLAAPAPQGFLIFTDPPSDYAQGAEFTSYVKSNWRYSIIITANGSQEQVQNSGIIGIVNYPTGQETETDALRESEIIQALQRKCPQEEFRQRLQNAQLKWQSALALAKQVARAHPAVATGTNASAQTIEFITTDGVKYEHVEITGHDEKSITIRTEDGVDRIAFERLPPDIQGKFNYHKPKPRPMPTSASQTSATDNSKVKAEGPENVPDVGANYTLGKETKVPSNGETEHGADSESVPPSTEDSHEPDAGETSLPTEAAATLAAARNLGFISRDYDEWSTKRKNTAFRQLRNIAILSRAFSGNTDSEDGQALEFMTRLVPGIQYEGLDDQKTLLIRMVATRAALKMTPEEFISLFKQGYDSFKDQGVIWGANQTVTCIIDADTVSKISRGK